MQKFICSIALLAFFSVFSTSAQSLQWSAILGDSGDDYSYSCTVDGQGNTIIVGAFVGTVDFDPGPGVSNHTAFGITDMFIVKLDPNGDFLWSGSFEGVPGQNVSRPYKVVTDNNDNIFMTGFFSDSVDFDIGPGTFILDSESSIWRDAFILKLNSSGQLQWVHQLQSNFEEIGYDITVDNNQDLLITGAFSDTVDFDPGPNTFNIVAKNKDAFFLKLSNAGNLVWAKSITGVNPFSGGDDLGNAIICDPNNDIYATGQFGGEVDFDPGPNQFVMVDSMGFDGYLLKLDANGSFLWAKQLASTSSTYGNDLIADASGVYLAGNYFGTYDSDPGIAVQPHPSKGDMDIFIQKFLSNGNTSWVSVFGSSGGDYSRSIDFSSNGTLYVSGRFSDTIDFDPGVNTSFQYVDGTVSGFVQEMTTSGNFVSTLVLGSTDIIDIMELESFGPGLTFTGFFTGTADLDPYASTNSQTSNGMVDVFVVRLDSASMVSIEENEIHVDVTLWPLPASNQLNINAGEGRITEIQLVDMNGRIVRSKKVNGRDGVESIDVSQIESGIYLLNINAGQFRYSKQIIIQ